MSIELAYRAGVHSLATIGEQYGVSDAGILKRAKKEGWTRDLSKKIRAVTERKVIIHTLSPEELAEKEVSEERLVEAVATNQTGVVRRQGERIAKLTILADKLTDELVHQTTNLELYEQLGELMHAPDEKGKDKLNEVYRKVTTSAGRIAAFRNLVETSKTLIGLERQNVGLADNSNGDADTPEQKVEMTDQEAARRIAFLFTASMQKGV